MKQLTLYLHAAATNDALDCLRSNPHLEGFTLMHCQGHSTSLSTDHEEAAIDQVVGFVPRIRIEVLLENDQVGDVIKHLRQCLSGSTSHGMWTITPILDSGKL